MDDFVDFSSDEELEAPKPPKVDEDGFVELDGATKEDKDFIDHSKDSAAVVNAYNLQSEYIDMDSDRDEDLHNDDPITEIRNYLFTSSEASNVEGAKRLYAFMDIISRKDRNLHSEDKPAIEKTASIDGIYPILKYQNTQAILIENHVLTAIENWLSPYDDGTLPSNKVREMLYQVLYSMPVDKESLANEQCHIPSLIMDLYTHPIIDKWIRLFYNKSDNYKDLSSVKRTGSNSTRAIPTGSQLYKVKEAESTSNRVFLPPKVMDEFSQNVKFSPNLAVATEPVPQSSVSTMKNTLNRNLKRKRQASSLPHFKGQRPR